MKWILPSLCGLILMSLSGWAMGVTLSSADFTAIQQAQNKLAHSHPKKAWRQAQKQLQLWGDSKRHAGAKALMSIVLGRSALALDKNAAALKAFKAAFDSHHLDAQQAHSLLHSIAQLQLQEEQWLACVHSFNQWLSSPLAKNKPHSQEYYWLAYAHYQLKDYQNALSAIKIALSHHQEYSAPWYQLGVALAVKTHHWPLATHWQQHIVEHDAKRMRHWRQLSQLELKAKQNARALATMRIAWQRQLFNQESDYQLLSNLASMEQLPYLAAKVYQQGMQHGKISRNARHLKRQARLWNSARQYEQALPLLSLLVKRYPTAKNYQLYGNTLLTTTQWEKITQLYEQTQHAHMTTHSLQFYAAIAAINQQQWIKASQLLHPLLENKKFHDRASSWMNYLKQLKQVQAS